MLELSKYGNTFIKKESYKLTGTIMFLYACADVALTAAVATYPAQHQVLAEFVPEHVAPGLCHYAFFCFIVLLIRFIATTAEKLC